MFRYGLALPAVLLALSPVAVNATEGSAALKTRFQYYDYGYSKSRDFKEAPLNLEFQYRSGMYDDWIGLDFHAYTTSMVKGLSNKDDELGYTGGNIHPDGDTISNIGVFYLKTQFDVGDGKLRIGAGKNRRWYRLYNEQLIRVNNSATRGIDFDYKRGNAHYYGMMVDRFQDKTSGDYLDHFYGLDGEELKFVGLLGTKGNLGGFNYTFEYMNSYEFLQRSFYSLDHDVSAISTNVQLSGVNIFGAGEHFDLENYESGYVALTSLTTFDTGTKLKFSGYQVYGGDMYQLHARGGSSSRSMSHHAAPGGEVPMFEDERVFYAHINQDFSNILWPGLSGWIQGMWSHNAEGFDDYKRREVVSRITQDFGKLNPALKGLSINYFRQYQYVGGEDNGYRDGKVSNLGFFEDYKLNRITLDYTIQF
ncbi:hypothetical protein [Ferrimonas pelagia]|uniref:Outer membrane porin, OprD family n=1 Tax=Ferrimonas pelagia TaxID=1177826 RepID=A0ABP9F1U9_9GAMM